MRRARGTAVGALAFEALTALVCFAGADGIRPRASRPKIWYRSRFATTTSCGYTHGGMHWPSFLAGLLVVPAFVVFAGLAASLMQALRRRRSGYLATGSATPLPRGAEPLEFTSRVAGRIGRHGTASPRGSARAS